MTGFQTAAQLVQARASQDVHGRATPGAKPSNPPAKTVQTGPARTASSPAATPAMPDLPGLGPALWDRICTQFTPEGFARILRDGDVEKLASLDGISDRRATEWVLIHRGIDPNESFAATPPAKKVLEDIQAKLVAYASTRPGRNALRLIRILDDPKACQDHMAYVMKCKAEVAKLDRKHIQAALRQLRPLAPPTPRFDPLRAIVYENDTVWTRLRTWGLERWVAMVSRRDTERAVEHEMVIAVYEDGFDVSGFEQAIEVALDEGASQIVPEMTIAFFRENRPSLEAASRLADALGRTNPAAQVLNLLDEGSQKTREPPSIEAWARKWCQDQAPAVAEKAARVQLSGLDLLQARNALPAPLAKILCDAQTEAREALKREFGVWGQVLAPALPLRLDDDEIQRLQTSVSTRRVRDAFAQQQKLAKELETLRAAVESQVAWALAFDAPFALGSFALDYDLLPAEFGNHLAFKDALHLDVSPEGAQRIKYHMGPPDRIVLLTGANSGGKTTHLEMVAQIVLMARMGLPVAGRDATVPWLDELHYVTARRSLDAGAFEAFLRTFLPVTLGQEKRMVLADEVESVTELESATRILGFTLDRLAKTESFALVVSHLAPHILAHVTAAVRVDGIEATGLDAEHRLIVDRQPRMGHLARSTPELIVQRMAGSSRGALHALYEDLLGALRGVSKAGK